MNGVTMTKDGPKFGKNKFSVQTMKKRYKQLDDDPHGVNRAYELHKEYMRNKGRVGCKNIESLLQTNTYPHFYKLGKFFSQYSHVDVSNYLKYLSKNYSNRPSMWYKESTYQNYLTWLDSVSNAGDAIENTLLYLQSCAEDSNLDIHEYISSCPMHKIIWDLRIRKISPWVFLHSRLFLNRYKNCPTKDRSAIDKIINPDYWYVQLRRSKSTKELAKAVVEGVGI